MSSTLLGLEVLAQKQMGDTVITAARGSVLQFTGSAIVNAANERCLGGGGVDGAITDAGGDSLADAREALPILDNRRTRCRSGDAVLTIGGELNNEWCIHAVGPNYRMRDSIEEADEELASAYRAAMREAASQQMPSVAFSLLSAGVFRGPQTVANVLSIAMRSVAESVYPGLEHVLLCAYTDNECWELVRALEAA